MKKVIGGKTYVEVPEKVRDSCEGCVAWPDAKRDNWKRRAVAYEKAIRETLADNGHLADGDDCTLIKLKRVLDDTTPARATDNQSPS